MINIAIIEDNPASLKILKEYIDAENDMVVLKSFNQAKNAITYFEEHPVPQIMIIDLALPGMHGSEAVAYFRHKFEQLKIMVLTLTDDVETIINGFADWLRPVD